MATWSVMADVPNPIIVDAAGTAGSGYVLKAFLPGTTTSTSIAIDSAGSSPQTSITANADGKWEVTGNEILPYIDRKHKWGIFANAVDAAANTPFYMGPFNNVERVLDGLSLVIRSSDYVAVRALNSSLLIDGNVIKVTDDGIWGDFVVKTGTVTDNGGTLIVFTDDSDRYAERMSTAFIDVQWFGAKADGVTDDLLACQAAIDYVQDVLAGGTVFFPTGTYDCSAALTQTDGDGVFLRGTGRSSIIRNNTSGNVVEMGDGVSQFADCGLIDLFLLTTTAGAAGLLLKERTNFNLDRVVISSSGAAGYCVKIEGSFDTKINGCTLQGVKGFAIHMDSGLTSGPNAIKISGTRMDGNRAFASIGVFVQNTAKISIVDSSALQGFGGCGVLTGTQTEALTIDDCYFEDNGDIGVTFTGAEARTIRADIILNGGTFPELNAANTVRCATVINSFFQPGPSDLDQSIYLIGTEGFTEHSNIVSQAYNVPDAAFIRTKNKSSIYSNINASLGNSKVTGFPTDMYLDVENLNDDTQTAFQELEIKSMVLNPNFAPRFDAHSNLSPASYSILTASATSLSVEVAQSRYKGRQSFNVTRSGVGSSNFYGSTITETNHADFWDGQLWILYFEVRSVSGVPGFEAFIDTRAGVGGVRVLSGGGDATTSAFKPRTVLFKPKAGFDFNVGYRMTGGTGADIVRITRPVVCPLGALPDLDILDIPGLHSFTSTDTTPSVKDGQIFKTAGTTAITDFDDGQVGDTIHILATASITITDGSPIVLSGSADFTMTDSDTLTLTMFNDQVWQEVGRSVN